MTIFAITLTYNGRQYLDNLYNSLKKAANQLNEKLYWFIRDNNSVDNTELLVNSWSNNDFVKYFKIDHNRDNFSKCNNFLIDKIKEVFEIKDTDYLLFLNNDITIIDPKSIKYMVDIIKNDPDVGIVGAKLYYPGGKLIQHFGVAISARHGNNPWHIYNKEKDSIATKTDKQFQAVTAAFMLIRYSCFVNLDGGKLNEKYFWCFEDTDVALQVNINQKKKVICCAKTNIIHHESATLQKNPVNKMFMNDNVRLFKQNWEGKCEIDYDKYINNPNYNIYRK